MQMVSHCSPGLSILKHRGTLTKSAIDSTEPVVSLGSSHMDHDAIRHTRAHSHHHAARGEDETHHTNILAESRSSTRI